jgi:hypothetical protein
MLDDPVHHPHILGETAARGLETGCDPNFLVYRALCVDLTLAVEALPAGNMMEGHDAIARFELSDAGTHCRHYAGRLVTVYTWRFQQVVFDF